MENNKISTNKNKIHFKYKKNKEKKYVQKDIIYNES